MVFGFDTIIVVFGEFTEYAPPTYSNFIAFNVEYGATLRNSLK